ncbi:MAG TPA: cellulase family glycosylhydrolase [Acidobacteriaceae bacterium]|nr:cellulase family glycosylhydrolase [Acidobacteriaceae bacterium]
MSVIRVVPALACAVVLAVGCGGGSTGLTTQTTTTSTGGSSGGTGKITISSNVLMKDGVPWTPRALQLNAFVASPAAAAGVYAQAYQHFTLGELSALQAWGADTVRFQIGQPEMDPQSSLYSAAFVGQVQAAVAQAKTLGLTVILSVQDAAATGETAPASLPNAGTTRAWSTLMTIANGDQGILFEMFSEPSLSATPTNWTAWQSAFQSLVTALRGAGAKNVLLADGLQGGTTFAGAPALTDTLAQTGFAVQPWFFPNYRTTAAYDAAFGNLAGTNVVVATAWSTLDGGGYTEYCGPTTPADAQTLLNYLLAKKIGVTGFAFDDPGYGANLNMVGTIVQDLNGTPTTFAGGTKVCGDAGFGPGAMMQGEFKTGIVPAP